LSFTLPAAFASKDKWADHLRSAGLHVLVAPNNADLSRVEFAICWQPEPGILQRCPNLRAIQSMGAGVDSLLQDTTLPRHVPLLRVVDPLMAQRMATWVLWGVINIQRKCDNYWIAQSEGRWDKSVENFRNVDNAELKVGVMGLGVMGGAVADTLATLGYSVSAWTRRERSNSDHRSIVYYHGEHGLPGFLSTLDIVICLLPLTPETKGILNTQLFKTLPRGAAVINAARGGHCVEPDLLEALDDGHLSSAILDVFATEPLPPTSRLWKHPKVRVFPHVSSMTNIETAIEQMLQNREHVLSGAMDRVNTDLVVDWEAGY
jgi:glyoxylate/hydroxypyruvate reductase A